MNDKFRHSLHSGPENTNTRAKFYERERESEARLLKTFNRILAWSVNFFFFPSFLPPQIESSRASKKNEMEKKSKKNEWNREKKIRDSKIFQNIKEDDRIWKKSCFNMFTLDLIEVISLTIVFGRQCQCIEKDQHNDRPVQCLWFAYLATNTPHSTIYSSQLLSVVVLTKKQQR